MMDLKNQTIQDFGEQWTAFRDNPAYYGSADLLADIFGPLLSLDDVKGRRVADIGSGTGRIVNMLLDAGAEHVHAVEPSAAMDVLVQNTSDRQHRITYIREHGEKLPEGIQLDLVVSIGVLHHIPDPAPVVTAVFKALKPGGRCLVWLYGREGNETYLSFIEPLRRLTTQLPHSALMSLSRVLNLGLGGYLALSRVLPLPMRAYMQNVIAHFPQEVRRLTIYDQLNPAYAKYYKYDEAYALLAAAGFDNVQLHHRHKYSWTVIGTRP
jgi:SAM-dependent methyltransferase